MSVDPYPPKITPASSYGTPSRDWGRIVGHVALGLVLVATLALVMLAVVVADYEAPRPSDLVGPPCLSHTPPEATAVLGARDCRVPR